jgi:hypothetical protein
LSVLGELPRVLPRECQKNCVSGKRRKETKKR